VVVVVIMMLVVVVVDQLQQGAEPAHPQLIQQEQEEAAPRTLAVAVAVAMLPAPGGPVSLSSVIHWRRSDRESYLQPIHG
jgi:hypothetical protein